MFGLHAADLTVLVLYLVGITVLGVWTARRVHTAADFFMPRRFGKPMMMMHAFGTGTHSDQAVSVASKTASVGLSGIWYQWLWLFATPFYWLIAPVMRRFRAITTADVFEARFDRSVAMLFALVGMVQLMVNIGVMLKGSGAVIAGSTSGQVSADLAIAVMTVLFVVYGVAGGLGAAIVTDFVQGLLTVVFSFLLLPYILGAAGGIAGLHEKIRDPQMFSLVAPAEIGVFYIVMIALNGLIGIVTQPHTMGNCAAGRTEMDGRVGFMGGTFVKRLCTAAWCLTGLAAVAYYGRAGLKPDEVYGQVAAEFLPKVVHGMLGLFLASLLASVMSSCDSFMVASSGLFTENLYKPLVAGRSERHYVTVGRIATVAIVAGGVVFAYRLPNVVEGLEIFWRIAPMMGIAFWLGLFWRRATPAGAWAATLTGFGLWFLSDHALFIEWLRGLPWAEPLRLVFDKAQADGTTAAEMYLPWQMVFYLSGGTLAGIVVSLLTPRVAEEKLEAFYALVRTPVRPGEPPTAPCTLPAGVAVQPRRKLIPLRSLEILVPSWTSAAGFAAGWAIVVAIIAVFYWISRG
jgi:Na+/proline symporter